jgi:type I restriction enzyme S subunit
MSSTAIQVQTPEMSAQWTDTTLGEFADFEMGQAPPGNECNKEGRGTVFVKAGEFADLYPVEVEWTTKPLKYGRKGDVFICVVGATAGKLNLGIDCAIGRSVSAIRPRDGVDTKFIYYQLMPWVLKLRAASAGSAQGVISKAQLKEIPFKVVGIDQQKRIVAEIEKQFSRLDEAVANLKRVKANLKRYKAAVLKAAVEGRLVETEAELARREDRSFETGEQLLQRILETRRSQWQGKGKYKEPAAPDTSDLPELPEGWVWASLDQIGQECRPIIYGIIKPGPHDPKGVPYVRVTEMKDGFVDLENLRRAAPERAAKFARATLAPGDVLISKDGTIGRVAVVPPQLAGGNITQHVMRAPIHELMCRDYVVWAIRSDFCEKWLTGETKGVALRGVNVEDFRRLPIPVPPVIDQERILAEVERRFSILGETETQVETNLKRAEGLRQAVLASSFSSSSAP